MDQLLLWPYTCTLMASYSYSMLNEGSIASNLQTPEQSHFPPIMHRLDHTTVFICPRSASKSVGGPRQLFKWLCLEGHCFPKRISALGLEGRSGTATEVWRICIGTGSSLKSLSVSTGGFSAPASRFPWIAAWAAFGPWNENCSCHMGAVWLR